MKLHLLSENLQKKLSFVNRAVSTKSQLPVLSGFLLKTKGGKLQISGTDLEIGTQIEVVANTEEEGATTVLAKTFTELISALPLGKITLQTEKNNLLIITQKTKTTLQTIPENEFPKLYEEKGEKILIFKKGDLEKDFLIVVFAAAFDIGRPALSGVLIKKTKEGFSLVATDGYRLSLKNLNPQLLKKTDPKKLESPLLIPARVFRELIAMEEEDQNIEVFISQKNNQILFEQNGTILVGRLIDAEYPTYEKIIPANFSTKAVFDKEEIQKAVKICSIFARETANIVRLSLTKDLIIVSANTPSIGENTVSVEAKLEGEGAEIAFNAKYLLDLFSAIEDGEMVLEMTGPLNPGVFKIKGDDTFLHLIMPIRVQE